MDGADDERIWRHAREHGFVIVSKDSDFMHRSVVRGHPPKVIQLRVGNDSTDALCELILSRKADIRTFLKLKDESLLILQ